MRCSPAGWLIPHNLPPTERDHALIAHGLVVANGQPFGELATRPALGRGPTSTYHAIVLGDRHGRSAFPQGKFGPLARKPVSEVAYADRWGVAWPN